jgi:hypothetical protein
MQISSNNGVRSVPVFSQDCCRAIVVLSFPNNRVNLLTDKELVQASGSSKNTNWERNDDYRVD